MLGQLTYRVGNSNIFRPISEDEAMKRGLLDFVGDRIGWGNVIEFLLCMLESM